jgi:hypothetical protein
MPTLSDIRTMVRRITGKLSSNVMTNEQINEFVDNYYLYDFPEQLRLSSLKTTYQFLTNANQPTYDFPKELYVTNSPPCYIGGYQALFSQNRDSFYRLNPRLNYLQQAVATGTNSVGPYTMQATATPIIKGSKRSPPGAYFPSTPTIDTLASDLQWTVLVSGLDASGTSVSLIDDGLGNLFDPEDISTQASAARGSVNYITGVIVATFKTAIATGASINLQAVPYQASRPTRLLFYADQIQLWPIPDQAYQVSLEVYRRPSAMENDTDEPQLREWWQALAYGAADKIFAMSGDIENLQKYRPLLDEQLTLIQRRSIVQQTPERAATIYSDGANFSNAMFTNPFTGF